MSIRAKMKRDAVTPFRDKLWDLFSEQACGMDGADVTTPGSAMKRAASVTLFASMARTAKYPLSDASAAEPTRPPNAKTCTHESAEAGSARSSPSLRAISAMDLSIMIVEIGSSMGRVAKPKAPPPAPEAVAKALCKSCDPARGVRCIVRNATLRATSRLLEVAVAIAFEAAAGNTSDELNRLAQHIGEARSKSRMFKRSNGTSQCCQIFGRYACQVQSTPGRVSV